MKRSVLLVCALPPPACMPLCVTMSRRAGSSLRAMLPSSLASMADNRRALFLRASIVIVRARALHEYVAQAQSRHGGLQVERMRDRSGKLMNLRDSKRVAEIERNMSRWDERQLLRSGVVERVVEDEDEDDRERVMLVVNSAKPPFLDGRQIFTKQMDPVLPLKDPTSDMAVVARRGSKLVMQVPPPPSPCPFTRAF